MFCTGTHAKKWTFETEAQLAVLRKNANAKYISGYEKCASNSTTAPDFLTAAEERLLCKYFECALHDFCKKFKPPMPKSVISCSFHYYKRFYINNSVMDYHPKHIIVTCVFLACKVEEFNVSIMQFVGNVKGDRAKAKEIILGHELLLMQQLKYNLIIHHPHRPVEGFLIDIKTRCPEVPDPERFRPIIDEFLDRMCFTDAFLLYAPSQIALAAIAYAAMKFKESLQDVYISKVLFADSSKEKLQKIKDSIRNIWMMVRAIEALPREQVKAIEKKLEKCRNEENNPSSIVYKRKLEEMQRDEELEQTKKYKKIVENQQFEEEEVLGARMDS